MKKEMFSKKMKWILTKKNDYLIEFIYEIFQENIENFWGKGIWNGMEQGFGQFVPGGAKVGSTPQFFFVSNPRVFYPSHSHFPRLLRILLSSTGHHLQLDANEFFLMEKVNLNFFFLLSLLIFLLIEILQKKRVDVGKYHFGYSKF